MSHVDPGLDEPALEAAKHVDQDDSYDGAKKQAEEEEDDYLDPR